MKTDYQPISLSRLIGLRHEEGQLIGTTVDLCTFLRNGAGRLRVEAPFGLNNSCDVIDRGIRFVQNRLQRTRRFRSIRRIHVAKDECDELAWYRGRGRSLGGTGKCGQREEDDGGTGPPGHRSPSTTRSFPSRRTVTFCNESACASR